MRVTTHSFIEDLLSSFFNQNQSLLKTRRVLIACSGGPDSIALCRALKSLEEKLNIRFIIGHVNHHLRGKESILDEEFVKKFSDRLGWRVLVANKKIDLNKSGNLESRARVARYDSLEKMALKVKANLVLTAHTIDDQVETFFLNLFRGAGIEGLGGMSSLRTIRTGSRIMLGRPFLEVEKIQLVAYLKSLKQSFCVDRTNSDTGFLRNWIRSKLTPLIRKRVPGAHRKIAQFAQIFRDEQGIWDEVLPRVQDQVLKRQGKMRLLDFESLLRYSPAVQRRLIRSIIDENILTYDAVENLRRWMQKPPSERRTWQLRKGWEVERLSKSKGSPSAQLFWIKSPPRTLLD